MRNSASLYRPLVIPNLWAEYARKIVWLLVNCILNLEINEKMEIYEHYN